MFLLSFLLGILVSIPLIVFQITVQIANSTNYLSLGYQIISSLLTLPTIFFYTLITVFYCLAYSRVKKLKPKQI